MENEHEEIARKIIEMITPVIRQEIKLTVNGKIDRMQDQNDEMEKKLDIHIANVKPMIDLIEGSLVARKILLWFTSIILAIMGVYAAVKNI